MYQNNYNYPMYGQTYPQPYADRLAQLQSQYQQAVPQAPMQAPQNAGQGILWVQGEAGAKAYLMAPNTTILLMDSEGQRFYLKSTDNSGVPTLRTFKYSEVTSLPVVSDDIPANKYVTREEYDEIKGKVDSLLQSIENIKPKGRSTKTEVNANEQSDI